MQDRSVNHYTTSRDMTVVDLPLIVAMEKKWNPRHFREQPFFERHLALSSSHCRVLFYDNDFVGYYVAQRYPDKIQICTLAIRADIRGYGLGSRLLTEIMQDAKKSKVQRIEMLLWDSNTNGNNFLQALGASYTRFLSKRFSEKLFSYLFLAPFQLPRHR